MGEDVAAVATGEEVAAVKTHAKQQHMGAHPLRTTIPGRDGTIRGERPINKPRSNASTIGSYAAAVDGMCHSGTLAKRAPESAAGIDTCNIVTGAMRLA